MRKITIEKLYILLTLCRKVKSFISMMWNEVWNNALGSTRSAFGAFRDPGSYRTLPILPGKRSRKKAAFVYKQHTCFSFDKNM